MDCEIISMTALIVNFSYATCNPWKGTNKVDRAAVKMEIWKTNIASDILSGTILR